MQCDYLLGQYRVGVGKRKNRCGIAFGRRAIAAGAGSDDFDRLEAGAATLWVMMARSPPHGLTYCAAARMR